MKKRVFTGVGTALVTPMCDDYSVDYNRLESLVNEQIVAGVDALIICGTTGEKSTLRYDEHVRVIEVAANAACGRVPIIAGTGSNDTVYSVELCNDARSVGADAFLMVAPYYNKTSQSGLVAHYNYIADRVDRPIILYNVPSRTGVAIQRAFKAFKYRCCQRGQRRPVLGCKNTLSLRRRTRHILGQRRSDRSDHVTRRYRRDIRFIKHRAKTNARYYRRLFKRRFCQSRR